MPLPCTASFAWQQHSSHGSRHTRCHWLQPPLSATLPLLAKPLQVAFQLYEDAPQELRSRLWMAVLEHPELCKEYQASRGWQGVGAVCVWGGGGTIPRCLCLCCLPWDGFCVGSTLELWQGQGQAFCAVPDATHPPTQHVPLPCRCWRWCCSSSDSMPPAA